MKAKTIFLILITVILLVLSACSPDVTEDLLDTSVSPNGTHTVQSYRVSAGATVDFSVKCYLIDNNKKCEIYNQYHQSKAEIKWLDEDIIKINDVALDLSKGETFNWRK